VVVPTKLNVGDVLATSAKAIASGFVPFLAISCLCVIPGVALSFYFQIEFERWYVQFQQSIVPGAGFGPATLDPSFAEDPWSFFPMGLFAGCCVSYMVQFVLTQIAQGSLVHTTVEFMAGRKSNIGDAFGKGLAKAPTVIIAAFLVSLLLTLSAMPIMFGMTFVGALIDPGLAVLCMCCGVVFSVLPPLWLYVIFCLAIPAAVAERIGPIGALQRTVELTKGHRLQIFGCLMILLVMVGSAWAIGCMASSTASVAGGGIDVTTGLPKETSAFARVVQFTVAVVLQLFITITSSAMVSVIYARIVGIRDGIDAEKLAEVFA